MLLFFAAIVNLYHLCVIRLYSTNNYDYKIYVKDKIYVRDNNFIIT